MNICLHRSFKNYDASVPAVVAVGKFDGLHFGHQTIFRRMQELKATGLKAVILSLFPPPEKLLHPDAEPEFISTIRQRLSFLESFNIDTLILKRFDLAFSQITAEEFITDILINKLNTAHLLIGEDSAFGYQRRGTRTVIESIFREYSRKTEVIPSTVYNGSRVGTYWLRSAVQSGDMATFRALTGRNFKMDSIVVRGDGRGKKIGFPTANLKNNGQIMPANGIYATKVRLNDKVFDSVTSVGVRPTFDNGKKVVEVHLLDFDRDLYGERLEVEFVSYLRAELKYKDISSLCRQIEADIENSRKLLKTVK